MEQYRRNLLADAAERRIISNDNKTANNVTEEEKLNRVPSTSTANGMENFLTDLPDSSQIHRFTNRGTIKPNDVESASSSSNSSTLLIENCADKNYCVDDDSTEMVKLSFFNRCHERRLSLPVLEPLENHTVMFSPCFFPDRIPLPFPESYRDQWDGEHVRMPCSPQNTYVDYLNGQIVKSRWDLICQTLLRPIESSLDLESAILEYNRYYRGKWSFDGLHAFINIGLSESERAEFLKDTLPLMVCLALRLPQICTQPIPLLKKGKDHYVTMSQQQIGSLLLNAFFCTFPRRNFLASHRLNHEYADYPSINFNRLFRYSANMEKLKCLMNYFRRIVTQTPTGAVTFHRQSLREFPRWYQSTQSIRMVVIKSDGLIENEGHGMLQVDFANKFVGGGVLGQGCVQEEIRFLMCPELIVSRLFLESLGASEVLIVTGVERYNKYSGYRSTFQWEGDFQDPTSRDEWGRRYNQVVAMDATYYKNAGDQFTMSSIEREVNKAYCGFYDNTDPTFLPAVASGNWGCGIFNGHPSLKFILQLMAASEADRDMLYFTFGNTQLQRELRCIYNFLSGNNLSVGDVWRLLVSYLSCVTMTRAGANPGLYAFLSSFFRP